MIFFYINIINWYVITNSIRDNLDKNIYNFTNKRPINKKNSSYHVEQDQLITDKV